MDASGGFQDQRPITRASIMAAVLFRLPANPKLQYVVHPWFVFHVKRALRVADCTAQFSKGLLAVCRHVNARREAGEALTPAALAADPVLLALLPSDTIPAPLAFLVDGGVVMDEM